VLSCEHAAFASGSTKKTLRPRRKPQKKPLQMQAARSATTFFAHFDKVQRTAYPIAAQRWHWLVWFAVLFSVAAFRRLVSPPESPKLGGCNSRWIGDFGL